MVSNTELIALLSELTVLTKLEEATAQSFRIRAYETAIQALEDLPVNAVNLSETELLGVSGIGKGIVAFIRDVADGGTTDRLDELRLAHPPSVVELLRLPGLGPKKVRLLRSELGIESVEELGVAIEAEALRALPGLGAKTEQNLAAALERLGRPDKERRTPIADAHGIAEALVADLITLPSVTQAQFCGSLRRYRESVGDIDIVAESEDAEPVMAHFVESSLVETILAHGPTKSAILTREGLQIDLRVVPPDSYGAALVYFTGSKAHNIELRTRALARGWSLNEYGFSGDDPGPPVKDEESVYAALGLEWISPPLREGSGEIAASDAGTLPNLVTTDQLRGDLHVHSDWSGDGRSGLEAMISTAFDLGFAYVAITDHGELLTMNGMSREKVIAQRAEIARLRETYPLVILHGCELNIGADGGIDYDPEFLTEFDYGVASIHSHFDLDQTTQTKRLLAAIENPAVNAIGHPSGRRIGSRPGVEYDVDAVFEAATETDTALEINSGLHRLDLPGDLLRRHRHQHPPLIIDSDAHHISEFGRLRHGVANAQRGWVDADSVVNTWDTARFLSWVRAKRA